MWVANTEPDPQAARAEAEAVEAARTARFGPDSNQRLETLRLRRDLDALLPGGRVRAIELGEELASASRAQAPGSLESLEDATALGELLRAEGNPTQASDTLAAVVEEVGNRPTLRDLRARALLSLGAVLARSPDDAEMERGLAMLDEANVLAADVWGIGHPIAFQARGDLAVCLMLAKGDDPQVVARAMQLIDESIEIDRRLGLALKTLPGDRSNLATILALVAIGTSDVRGMERARADALEALASARERLGPTSDQTLQIARAAAVTVAMTGGDLGASERLLREAAEVRGRNGESAGSVEMLTLSFELGRVLRAQGRIPEARADLAEAQRAARAERPPESESRWLVATLLLATLEDLGAEASQLQEQREEVEALRAADAAAKKPHGCPDWRALPWHARYLGQIAPGAIFPISLPPGSRATEGCVAGIPPAIWPESSRPVGPRATMVQRPRNS